MIRFLLHVFIVVLVFGIEIHVRAEEVTQYPRECLARDGECFLQNVTANAFEWGKDDEWTLSAGGFAHRISAHNVRHFTGVLRVQAEDEIKMLTEFGELKASEGDVLSKKENTKWTVWALSTDVVFQLKGKKQTFNLPKGFTVEIGGINTDGVNTVSIPQPIRMQDTAVVISKTFVGGEGAFKSYLSGFLDIWKAATEQAAVWQQGLLEREVASNEQKQQQRAHQQEMWKQETQRILRMFRERNFLSN